MMWLTAVFLSVLAATVFSAPLTSTSAQRAVPAHLVDQGDGAYIATFDENGKANVAFTPMAVLLAQDPALPPSDLTSDPLNIPDEDIYCAGYSHNEHDLDIVNEKVLKWVQGTEFQAKSWGWIHYNKETSYVCPYQAWVGDHAVTLAAHTTITRACNSRAKYGWVRFRGTEDTSGAPPPDFSIGRTWRGNHFCTELHAPPENPNDHNEESLDLRDGLHDPGTATLAIPSHLRDQGDGFYLATLDAEGQVNVKFTPKAVVIAEDAALPPKNVVAATENIAALDQEVRCDGTSKNAYDLKWADEKVCQLFSDMELPAQTWAWFHNEKQTSFICPYTAWSGDFSTISNAHNTISNSCKDKASYGYVRYRGGKEIYNYAIDVSIGRTWRGNHFCNDNFAPPFNVDPHGHEDSLYQRDEPRDHVESESAQLAIPDHLRDQGDGFYSATYDDAGKMIVEFTPMDVLLANSTSDAHEKRNLPQEGMYGHHYTCGPGEADSWRDLGRASDELASKIDGVYYKANSWQWVHNVGETAFFCPYRDTHITFADAFEINKLLNKRCGNKFKYGYLFFDPPQDVTNPGKYAKYSLGRTHRGDHFCTDTFAPGTLDQRNTLIAHNDVSLDQGEGVLEERDESLHQVESSMDQGDGMYTATFDHTGKMSVAFTSKAELVARDAEASRKRKIETWCAGAQSKNTDAMNRAIVQLAKNARGVHWNPNHWGWVHDEQETAYFCPYFAWDGLYNDVIELNKRIDEGCGSRADYGFFRHVPREGDKGLPNFSVGRTYRGNYFCTGFHAPGLIEQEDVDQGDGFYAAVLDDDTGKVNITFTPKDVLLARDGISDNPSTKSIRALEKRDGIECVDGESKNQADLDYATSKVAEGVEGLRYDPTVWTWFHNNKETVYVCCYRAWHGSSKTVWDYIGWINEGCQSKTEYGYNHHAARNEADINLSVGRTWRGNKFCDRFHHPNPPSGT